MISRVFANKEFFEEMGGAPCILCVDVEDVVTPLHRATYSQGFKRCRRVIHLIYRHTPYLKLHIAISCYWSLRTTRG